MDEGSSKTQPQIVERYTDCGINVAGIVKRIIKYAPADTLQGLRLIRLLDRDPNNVGFASYIRNEATIELYVTDILGWQPWLLRKSYIIPYISVGIALGHELDHHVNRGLSNSEKERSAESNALRYIYPSLGILKPVVKFLSFVASFWCKGRLPAV